MPESAIALAATRVGGVGCPLGLAWVELRQSVTISIASAAMARPAYQPDGDQYDGLAPLSLTSSRNYLLFHRLYSVQVRRCCGIGNLTARKRNNWHWESSTRPLYFAQLYWP